MPSTAGSMLHPRIVGALSDNGLLFLSTAAPLLALNDPARRRREPAGVGRAVTSMRRKFVTQEGIDLQLELASACTRASAFLIDAVILIIVLLIATLLLLWLFRCGGSQVVAIIWLIGFRAPQRIGSSRSRWTAAEQLLISD